MNSSVHFLARGDRYNLLLTSKEAILLLARDTEAGARPLNTGRPARLETSPLRLELVGSNPTPLVTGIEELPGISNYFKGRDSDKWRTGVPHYRKVRLAGVYPGIDLIFYGNDRELEYDFVLAPGSDPKRIRIHYIGTRSARVERGGDLAFQLPGGVVRLRKPLLYQEYGDMRREITGEFRLLDGSAIGFKVGSYDKTLPLVIDPVVVYASYFGAGRADAANAIAVDSAGNTYIAGQTLSPDFSMTGGITGFSGGGVYSSSDHGESWTPFQSGLTYPRITTLAADPINSSVAYAGTDGAGIFLSKDGGRTWSPRNTGLRGLSVDALAIAPGISSTLYACTSYGLFKSIDGGDYWTLLSGDSSFTWVQKILLDPANSATLYIVTSYKGIYKSVDAGKTWNSASKGLPSSFWPRAAVIDPRNPSTLYAAGSGGSYKSTDGGANWQSMALTATVSSLAIDPVNTENIYAGTIMSEFFRSSNGGASWTKSTIPFDWATVTITCAAVDPVNPSVLYAGTDGLGLSKSTDRGVTWKRLSRGLPALHVTDVVVDPKDPGRLLTGTMAEEDGFIAKISSDGSTLLYSTYLGGGSSDIIRGIAVDSAGNAYVTGTTSSPDLPVGPANTFQQANAGQTDAFIAKLSQDGRSLLYCGYLGGTNRDFANAIALDGSGNAWITGETFSANFPTRNGFQSSLAGGYDDAFVAKISSDGSQLLYSSFLGGTRIGAFLGEFGIAIGLDSGGNVYVAGLTVSDDFPTTVGAVQRTFVAHAYHTFVTKLNPSGSALIYSTFLAGKSHDQALAIAIDGSGSAVVVGSTYSTDFPIKNAFQSSIGGDQDAFITRISPDGSSLIYSTYLGGNGVDKATGVVVDSGGNAGVVGTTSSANFPQKRALQSGLGGKDDLFITKLDPGGSLIFSTFLGGSDSDVANAIARDRLGNYYVAGSSSYTFPTGGIAAKGPFQGQSSGYNDALVLRISERFNFYIPFYQADSANFTGFGVSNSSDFAANLEMRAYGMSGQLLQAQNNPAKVTLPPHQQIAQLGYQLFGSNPALIQSGWVQLTTETGIGAFFQLGDGNRLDGAVAWTDTAKQLYFTRVFEGSTAFQGRAAETYLSIANPGDQPITIRSTLWGPSASTLLAEKVQSILPNGAFYGSVSELFGQSLSVSGGYIECEVVEGEGAVAFESIRLLDRSTVIGLNAATGANQNRSYSAQLAHMRSLFTNLKLVNTARQTRVVRLSAVNEDGGELAAPVNVTLGAGDWMEKDAGEIFDFPSGSEPIGSLVVDSDGPGVVGDVVFGDRTHFNYAAAMALQTRLLKEAVFSQVANNNVYWTGLALYNPGSIGTSITIQVYSAQGSKTAETTTSLGGGKRFSKLLTELLPSTAGQVGGYIVIRSERPIVAQQLFGDTGYNFLSAVPPSIFR